MVGAKKKVFSGKSKLCSATFDTFRQCAAEGVDSRTLVAKSTLNCDFRQGHIRTGIGMRAYSVNGKSLSVVMNYKPLAFYQFERSAQVTHPNDYDGLACLTEGGNLYSFMDTSGIFELRKTMSTWTQHAVVVGENKFIFNFFSGEGHYFSVANGVWTQYDMENVATPICACKNRLFLAKNAETVLYTDPAKPNYFSVGLENGGTVHLPYGFGKIEALVCFDNCVYVFQKRGVVRMDVKGSPTEFVLTPLNYSGGDIYGRSVGVCDNGIFFLAADGVYRCDGKNFKRAAEYLQIIPSVTNKFCGFGSCDDHYILQYYDSSNTRRTAAISFDCKSGYFMTDRDGLSRSAGKTFCKNSSNLVCVLAKNAPLALNERAHFTSEKTDFGMRGKKTLQRLRVEGEGIIEIYVYNEKERRNTGVEFSNGVAEFDVRLRGEEFYFNFVLGPKACVRKLTVEFVTAA